ncbi:MAG: helical backbone metal receptor [Gemmatimonadota bacterium]|nr:helical backbone metal receptor [Gemmatimonadota bacterium]
MSGIRRWAALALFVLLGCGGTDAPAPEQRTPPTPRSAAIEVVDDAGRTVRTTEPVERLVSLVPSVTETIVAIGAVERLVARTRYDEAPELAALPNVGGGLDPGVEAIVALDPDLVVAWNTGEGRLAERLTSVGIPVYLAEIQDTTAIYATLRRMGALTGRQAAADSVSRALRDTLAAIAAESNPAEPPSVFYWMAGDPPRTAGEATFIGQAIAIAGGRVAFPELNARWPAVSLEAVVERDPDVIVVPVGEGLPGAGSLDERPGWSELDAVRSDRVVEIPADLFARPGPRMGEATRALRERLERVLAPPPGSGAS